jgi:endo-1,4-beta-xylanase
MSYDRRSFLKSSLAFAASPLARAMPPASDAVIPCSGADGLRAHAEKRDLLVGSAVVIGQLRSDTRFQSLLRNQANILVADWQMKWNILHPTPTEFYFADADWLVSYTQSHGFKMRGHNLCWNEGLPPWFAKYANKSNARELLINHIQTVAGRYAGKIHSWDVVNEAILPDDGRPDGLRVGPWLTLAGPDYIDLAFRTAREADPHALLTYNQNELAGEYSHAVSMRKYVLALVKGMRQRGVPIDAVGIESHLSAPNSYGPGVVQFIRDLAALDLQVFITELDVDDARVQGTIAQRDSAVAAVYASYLSQVLQEPNVTALLTWEERDNDSWLYGNVRPDGTHPRPLPFDANYAAKPAFLSMRNAIDQSAGRQVDAAGKWRPTTR